MLKLRLIDQSFPSYKSLGHATRSPQFCVGCFYWRPYSCSYFFQIDPMPTPSILILSTSRIKKIVVIKTFCYHIFLLARLKSVSHACVYCAMRILSFLNMLVYFSTTSIPSTTIMHDHNINNLCNGDLQFPEHVGVLFHTQLSVSIVVSLLERDKFISHTYIPTNI